MSVERKLQAFDKTGTECSICLERFQEPKTLECIHSYCLKCLQSLLETQGKISCPKCCQTYDDLNKEDLENLPSNEMISHLVQYVEKIESERAPKCSSCDNQPRIYCSDCQLYMCKQCIKQHKIVPILKDHSLYKLDATDEQRNDQNCQIHCEKVVEFFCQNCCKRGCRKCEHVLDCYKNQHVVIEIKTAVDKFNQNVIDIKHMIEGIQHKLKQKLEIIIDDRLNIESQLELCRTAVENQEKHIIEKIKNNAKALINDMEEIYKDKMKVLDSQVKEIDSNVTEVDKILTSINTIMNKPEETETLRAQMAAADAVKDTLENFEKSFHKKGITPIFIPFCLLNNLIDINSIGQITNADSIYEIEKDNKSITVTEGQSFKVKVKSTEENVEHQLAATLVNELGEESATKVEALGNREYRINGRCNLKGYWQMKITTGAAHIKGSPVNIKVEKLGLVQTIENISNYKQHEITARVTDVMLGKDGSFLVSSYSKDLLKFNQSGSLKEKISVPQNVKVNRMHKMSNGHIVYSNDNASEGKHVIMCNEIFQEIRSFGKDILKYPEGLTVNEKTRILYVADCKAHCVFKFNIDDGKFLGKIGSEGSEVGQMKAPEDVTLTKHGYVIVADFGNSRIQMFGMKNKAMGVLVESGQEDGYVMGPCGVTIDTEENMLISSYHKLQLFDKCGQFIKRIDDTDDGLDLPNGNVVISNSPRRVAVANNKANNIKIFNY